MPEDKETERGRMHRLGEDDYEGGSRPFLSRPVPHCRPALPTTATCKLNYAGVIDLWPKPYLEVWPIDHSGVGEGIHVSHLRDGVELAVPEFARQ